VTSMTHGPWSLACALAVARRHLVNSPFQNDK
jgi:hypothetical protein